MLKMITAAFFAVLIGIEAGHAAAACPDGYITCADWCRTYRINTPANQQYCLKFGTRSCAKRFGSLNYCMRNQPPSR